MFSLLLLLSVQLPHDVYFVVAAVVVAGVVAGVEQFFIYFHVAFELFMCVVCIFGVCVVLLMLMLLIYPVTRNECNVYIYIYTRIFHSVKVVYVRSTVNPYKLLYSELTLFYKSANACNNCWICFKIW